MTTKVKQGIKKVTEGGKGLQREVGTKVGTYIAAALGLVVGLAWNDAIKTLIEYLFPLKQNTIAAKFFYAIIITIVLVLITAYIIRKPKEKNNS